jgi:tetratricopeptide (TPR) repeat protein
MWGILRVAVAASLALLLALPAHADEKAEQARSWFEQGTGAFALGKYAEAADAYERAFALKPDPALLYNAAQAHRLAGNKERALLLYGNYLRLFSAVRNRDEVTRHMAELEAAIESERHARLDPPTVPAPASIDTRSNATSGNLHATPATTTATTLAPAAQASSPPVARREPLGKRRWLWLGVGGAAVVVAGLGIGLGVGLGHGTPPVATFGVGVVR